MTAIEHTKHSGAVVENRWRHLRKFTDARIGLGRTGGSIPTKQLLEFQMDHANARDAVHIPLDVESLETQLPDGYGCLILNSQADNRATYLQRPDLGRSLSEGSELILRDYLADDCKQYNAAIVIVDGLSSTAVQAHAAHMTSELCNALTGLGYSLAPICIVNQGRVAVGDEIGEILGVDLLVLMVGERPGLSSPDSLGIYYTFKPKVGLQDSSRNCISNIRPAGLSFHEATDKLIWLIEQSIRIQQSGVNLKDQSEPLEAVEDGRSGNFLLENK